MKTIIAGSRSITDLQCVITAVINCGWTITEVVSGGARGVDTLGETYAKANSIPLAVFPADWANLGRKAGPIRNQQMSEHADALIAVWDGESRGTVDMIGRARKKGMLVHVVNIAKPTAAWWYDMDEFGL